MPEQGAFRQVDEKHVSIESELMVWSPKFDLVALSNVQGEVVLHRLSWQKVWSLAPPSEDVKVKAMSWRSDGKVLAVGYSSGCVNLCYIENSEVLHMMNIGHEVTCLAWVSQTLPSGQKWSCDPYLEDNTETYMPKLQPLNKSYGSVTKGLSEENVEDRKKLKGQKELNVLIVGTKSNELHLCIYGVFPVASISIGEQHGQGACEVKSAMLSEDLRSLAALVQIEHAETGEFEYSLVTFDTSILATHDKELHLLALKYGQISTLIGYLQSTIQQMLEAWEDILLEMDSKLYNFAEQKQASGAGTVSNDFLELLLFGTPSQELQIFLLHELTDKGLKKLGHSIETSYSNIQKLVVKHLQTVSQAILYQLSEIEGMSKFSERFSILGLEQKALHTSVMTAGSFVLKTSELQQVIDGSIKNFKAFFRWLYVVILRLSDEKPPTELSKMTQHDVNFVADFLRDNFAQFNPREEEESIDDLRAVSPTDKRPGFKLEKVGQYLKKENLSYPPDISGNPWVQFCRASYTIKDSSVLYPVETNKSLMQLQESLETQSFSTLHKPAVEEDPIHMYEPPMHHRSAGRPPYMKVFAQITIGRSMSPAMSMFLFSVPSRDDTADDGKLFIPKVTQFSAGNPSLLYTVFTADFAPSDRLFILTQPSSCNSLSDGVKITSVRFTSLHRTDHDTSSSSSLDRCDQHKILDVAYYDDKLLSVLLVEASEDQTPVLLQMPLNLLKENRFKPLSAYASVHTATDIPILDVGPQLETSQFRRLENMRAHSFAVSGSRNTATVLFSSRRRVRIFFMDAEEEDEEDYEDDDVNVSNQSEADQSTTSANDMSQSGPSNSQETSQSETGMQIDSSVEEGQEDKENSSLMSSGDHST